MGGLWWVCCNVMCFSSPHCDLYVGFMWLRSHQQDICCQPVGFLSTSPWPTSIRSRKNVLSYLFMTSLSIPHILPIFNSYGSACTHRQAPPRQKQIDIEWVPCYSISEITISSSSLLLLLFLPWSVGAGWEWWWIASFFFHLPDKVYEGPLHGETDIFFTPQERREKRENRERRRESWEEWDRIKGRGRKAEAE